MANYKGYLTNMRNDIRIVRRTKAFTNKQIIGLVVMAIAFFVVMGLAGSYDVQFATLYP